MLTPFSGLSLIVHLVVIGVAKLANIGKKKATDTYREPFSTSRQGFKSALSIILLVTITSLMLSSFVIALMTSIREAQNEWHVEFIKNEWVNVRDADFHPLHYVADNYSSLTISR